MNRFLLCLVSPVLRKTLCEPSTPDKPYSVALADIDEAAFRAVVRLACCAPGVSAAGAGEVIAKLADRLGVLTVREALDDVVAAAEAADARAAAERAAEMAAAELAAARLAVELATERTAAELGL